jgi:hypothetical protein
LDRVFIHLLVDSHVHSSESCPSTDGGLDHDVLREEILAAYAEAGRDPNQLPDPVPVDLVYSGYYHDFIRIQPLGEVLKSAASWQRLSRP